MKRENDKIQAFINLRQKLLSSLENKLGDLALHIQAYDVQYRHHNSKQHLS